ncbi:M28 family peptidase [Cytophagales bacterium LB-30]|uniref:M28 family peptidase n=1 Tax=Shiella aurantiaca TaxID=3058365 RepID=A0ABT8F6J0_9BACT|nr:M28 family peptidase [Shiella aurantiaca]MDN4165980.1 M28 family peptidase [Shiella aurantiaca]
MTRKLLSLAFFFALSFTLFAQSDEELVKATVQKNTIKGHIYFLASDELRGRETGSAEIDIAARYLSTTLQRYGVAPVPGAREGYFQDVPLVQVLAPSSYSFSLGNTSLTSEQLIRVEGAGIQAKADIVYVGHGSEEDFADKKLKGKIVIALAGTESASDLRTVFMESEKKAERAKKAEALGLVELHTESPENWSQISRYLRGSSYQIQKPEEASSSSFFKLWVKDDSKTLAKSLLSKKRQLADIAISETVRIPVPSKNVVGMVEGTDPELKNEFVIYSAHYDHIGVGKANAEGDSIFNGARDNAIGVVTVLSVAESLAKNPTKRSALFILFTAEEKGLWGSRYYAENPLLPLNQMVYCFNSDNGGYNDTSVATIVGLGRTTAEKHIKKASETFGLTAIDDPAGEQGLFDRSDNVNFAKKGIPAPTFSLGFTAFDAEIMKYYHQQADNPESVDYEYLEKFFRAYVLSSRLIANDPETPFWVEGDKYYPVGVELYKNK